MDKFQKGMVLYRKNKKTGEMEDIHIEEVLYRLSKPVENNRNHSAESLSRLIKDGILSDDYDKVKANAIKELEKQFGIKLMEV